MGGTKKKCLTPCVSASVLEESFNKAAAFCHSSLHEGSSRLCFAVIFNTGEAGARYKVISRMLRTPIVA